MQQLSKEKERLTAAWTSHTFGLTAHSSWFTRLVAQEGFNLCYERFMDETNNLSIMNNNPETYNRMKQIMMQRLSRSLSRFETQDIKTQPFESVLSPLVALQCPLVVTFLLSPLVWKHISLEAVQTLRQQFHSKGKTLNQ